MCKDCDHFREENVKLRKRLTFRKITKMAHLLALILMLVGLSSTVFELACKDSVNGMLLAVSSILLIVSWGAFVYKEF